MSVQNKIISKNKAIYVENWNIEKGYSLQWIHMFEQQIKNNTIKNNTFYFGIKAQYELILLSSS